MWDSDRGTVLVTILVVVLGVFIGLFMYGRMYEAEAVIGSIGNLSNTSNPHNFATNTAGINAVSETRICIFCHTPHSAIQDSSLLNAPLWNHTLSTQTYTVNSPGLMSSDPTVGIVNRLSPATQPDGASKLCLSCHDGTVSVGNVKSEASPIEMTADSCLTTTGAIANQAGCSYIGTDLRAKHVVSIAMNSQLISDSQSVCNVAGVTYKVVYPWAGVNNRADSVILRPTARQYSGNYGVTYSSMPANGKYRAGYNYGVQCSTCHDPHYWVNTADPQVEGYKFIVLGYNNLCMSCHDACGT